MRLLNVALPLLLALLLSNCSIDVSIDDVTADDFLKSTILATSRGIGDGQTSATVVVLLKNSDDSIVHGYKPNFDFINNGGSEVAGNGITYSDCASSNTQGISTCTFKSIEVGPQRILFNNIIVELVGEVFFEPPSRNGVFSQVLNSAQVKQFGAGYVVTSQVGAPFKGMVHKDDQERGYTIFTNTTGGITPNP